MAGDADNDLASASIFLQSIRRDLNCLTDPDRTARWKALQKLSKCLSCPDGLPSPDVLQDVWDDTICPLILGVFHDHVEKCRDIAISVTISIVRNLGEVERTMALGLPIMVERIGKLPVVEPSEEIRISLIRLLKCLISCCSPSTIEMNLEPISQILSISLADPFHEIKKEICDIISVIVSRTENISLPILEKLLKAILPNITHPHSKIRIAILQGINAIMNLCFEFDAIMDLLLPSIQALSFDRIEKVRKLFYECVVVWLRQGLQNSDFSNSLKKRVPQLLPLLLLGIFDESGEIGSATLLMVEDAGLIYERSLLSSSSREVNNYRLVQKTLLQLGQIYNQGAPFPIVIEKSGRHLHASLQPFVRQLLTIVKVDESDKFKDRSNHSLCSHTRVSEDNIAKVDCTTAAPDIHKSIVWNCTTDSPDDIEDQYLKLLPAPFKMRPGTGCRKIVQDFFEDLLSPLTKHLQEWTETARCGAARLLHALLIMGEGYANLYLDAIIPLMCSAVGDDNVSVAHSIVGASHILGWHMLPESWVSLVLPRIAGSGTTPVQVANGLVVTSGLFHGTQKNAISENVVIQVVQSLGQVSLNFKNHEAVQYQVLAVLTNIIASSGSHCSVCSSRVLQILIQVQSFGSEPTFKQAVVQMEETFAKSIGFLCAKELYRNDAECLLRMTIAEHDSWTADSYGQSIFRTLMQKVGDLIGDFMQLLLPTFKTCLNPDRDPSLRIQILQLLDELFEIPELASSWSLYAPTILSEILVPCGVWSVGKVGAAIRHAAIVGIWTFLRRGLCTQEVLQNLLHSEQLLPVLLSCMEEDYYVDIRIVTCHVLENILCIAGFLMSETAREEIRKALQKRMDDSCDNVRLRVLGAASAFFLAVPTSFSDLSVKSFASTLVLHMDDSNPQIQESVFEALQVCAAVRPVIIEEIITNECSRHQTKSYFHKLLSEATRMKRRQDDEEVDGTAVNC